MSLEERIGRTGRANGDRFVAFCRKMSETHVSRKEKHTVASSMTVNAHQCALNTQTEQNSLSFPPEHRRTLGLSSCRNRDERQTGLTRVLSGHGRFEQERPLTVDVDRHRICRIRTLGIDPTRQTRCHIHRRDAQLRVRFHLRLYAGNDARMHQSRSLWRTVE